MARSFGRVLVTIWDDDDFRALSPMAQRMYLFLLSQSDLEHSGLIPLRERRWARACGALDASQVTDDLKELESRRFIVTDEETEELLVRSLIRRDEVWKQPNVFKAAAASAIGAKSPRVKAVLYTEIQRLDFSGAGKDSRGVREGLLSSLEPFRRDQGTLPEPFAKGTDPDPVDNGGQNGHSQAGTPAEGFAGGSPRVRAKGEGESTCSSTGVAPYPFPLTPSPGAGAGEPETAAGSPAQVPEEEGDQDPGQDPADLIAELRSIRPDWSTDSIRRALSAQAVRERPWPLVCVAAVAMARDQNSKQPGRLEHDGPWWHIAVEPARDPPPPWCGKCDERTRLLERDDGAPARCPDCHPLTREEAP